MEDDLEELFAENSKSENKSSVSSPLVYLPASKQNIRIQVPEKDVKRDVINVSRQKSTSYSVLRTSEINLRMQELSGPAQAYRRSFGKVFIESFLSLKQYTLGVTSWRLVWVALYSGCLAFFPSEHSLKPVFVLLIGCGSDFIFSVFDFSHNGELICDDDEFHFIARTSTCQCKKLARPAVDRKCHNVLATFKAKNTVHASSWLSKTQEAISQCAYKPQLGSQRFFLNRSSFPVRATGNLASFFIDGLETFTAMARAILSAKREILITSWWLSPDLLLMRGGSSESSGKLLSVKAALAFAIQQNNVNVYILHFRESPVALPHDSAYTKAELLRLNAGCNTEKISIVRHPWSATGFWSHHEKIVIVDRSLAFFGGLDLTYGRFDTSQHKVWIDDDTTVNHFPGIDYYNPRLRDFVDVVKNSDKSLVNSSLEARMPWHDVHCVVTGACVVDLVRHFVERWNHAVRRNSDRNNSICVSPSKDIVESEYSRLIPNSLEACPSITMDDIRAHAHLTEGVSVFSPELGIVRSSMISCQIVRSASEWSCGSVMGNIALEFREDDVNKIDDTEDYCVTESCATDSATECSILNAYIRLIDESKRLIYIENQYCVSATPTDEQTRVEQTDERENTSQSEEDSINIDVVNADDCTPKEAMLASIRRNARMIKRCPCFPSSQSEVTNKIALALSLRLKRAMIEDSVSSAQSPSLLCIYVLPVIPSFQGDAMSSATNRAIMQAQFATIQWIYDSLAPFSTELHQASDYISFFTLRNHASIVSWVPVSDLNCPISGEKFINSNVPISVNLETKTLIQEEIYTHSKIMIVDDCKAIIGSSNINDRSMIGIRDSEIGGVIEDLDFIMVDSKKVGRFCHSLRVHLWAEHLGLLCNSSDVASISHVIDNSQDNPIHYTAISHLRGSLCRLAFEKESVVSEINSLFVLIDTMSGWNCVQVEMSAEIIRRADFSYGNNLFRKSAERNSKIYSACFSTIPSDELTSFSAYQERYTENATVTVTRIIQCAISLGLVISDEIIASVICLLPKLTTCAADVILVHLKTILLSKVQGHATVYPFKYLCNQNLNAILAIENLIPKKVFL